MATDGNPEHIPPGFDEARYLDAYADVREALAAGQIGSGLEHFRRWGRAEGRLPNAGPEPVLTEQARRDRVGAIWSVNPETVTGWYWMAHPMVRARVNALASGGDPGMDSYGRLMLLLRERGVTLPLGRAVSLGCGFGALERSLAAAGTIREIDAYDIAPAAIAEARRLAAEAGFHGLRYHLADLDDKMDDFPRGEVDVVFAHSSVHHVARLEALFAAVAAMLKPGGIFHLNEFVGPTRFQWTDAQIAAVNDFLEALPPRLRRLPSGQPRPLLTRPTVADMIAVDPSEAIRSAEIIPLLGQCFDIVELRELGGALLHLGLGDIAQNFDPGSPEDRGVLEAFFAAEDLAMRDGVVGSDFAVITAVARPPAPALRMDARATMPPSLTTRLSLLFPPAQRLHKAVRTLNHSVDQLAAENASLRAEQAQLTNRVSELAALAAPPVAPSLPAASTAPSTTPDPAPLFVPPGHYYSPIVNRDELQPRLGVIFDRTRRPAGIDLREEAQLAWLARLATFLGKLPFTTEAKPDLRYCYDNQFFSFGDGIVLGCTLLAVRPRRIVEVGSGFSSALMLDVVDRTPGLATEFVFIEPHTERLEGLLRPGDSGRVEILRHRVQDVDLAVFERLERDDILFIDSTHVAKTGSDVVHYMNAILPALKRGVLIHIHDIAYPFEYPEPWVLEENRSWNEIYMVYAFLAHNKDYQIEFFNNFMGRVHPSLMANSLPLFMNNPGGSLWLRKLSR